MQNGQVNVVDDVDQLIRGIDTINEYNLVKDYIVNRFGEFEGWNWGATGGISLYL